MLDLNQLIEQTKTLRKYQGADNTGVAPAASMASTVAADDDTLYGRMLPEVEVSESRAPEYSESLEDRDSRYQGLYGEYLESGDIPEDFIPYGQIEYGYDGGQYVDHSSDFASVWRTDNKTKERYDSVDVPMSEWLFGITESEGDRSKRSEDKNKANAPKTSDYNFSTTEGKEEWAAATNEYWDKISDEEYSKKDGWHKDIDGNWKPVPTSSIIDAYNSKLNTLADEETRVGIASGDISAPGAAPSRTNPGMGTNDLIAAALAIPAVLEPTPMGEAAWATWTAKNAPAIAAAGMTGKMLWDKATESGVFSNESIATQNILKERFETLTSQPLSDKVWETVNGVQGIYVNTPTGETFVSKDRVADLYGIPGQTEAHEAAQEASQTETTTMSGGEEPDPDKDKPRYKRYLEKVKGWGKDKINKLSKARESISDLNPFGTTFMKEMKQIPWGNATVWERMHKVTVGFQGKTWVGRNLVRLTYLAGIDKIQASGRGILNNTDEKPVLQKMWEGEQGVWDEKDDAFQEEFSKIINTTKTDPEKFEKDTTALIEKYGEDYIKDSIFFEWIKGEIPEDSLFQFESGYEEYGTKLPQFKTGGLTHTVSDHIRQFKEGGLMSRLQSYQGDQATGLPAGYEGVESPYPSITTPDDSYGEMLDYGGNVQPGMEGLNQYGFQNYGDWRSFMKQQPGFENYDWNNTTHWGKQHQAAWDWTTSNRTAEQVAVEEVTPTEEAADVDPRKTLSEEELAEMKNRARSGMFMDKAGRAIAGVASVIPAWAAWNQANKMEGESDEFHTIPDIKAPIVHIKAPINEINMQIEDVDDQMNMVVEKLKNSGASASAILAAEKQRRTAKGKLNAKKEDMLLKADAESQKITTAGQLDAAKQNQVKNIKMKLEEMDFRTATKKAKIDILQKLTNTVSGFILDEKKMYSDKNIAAIVTSALTAGTGLADRKRMIEMMISFGMSPDMIRKAQGGDGEALLEGTGY